MSITAADLLWDSNADFRIEDGGQGASFSSVQNWRIIVDDPSHDDIYILSNMGTFGVPGVGNARGVSGIDQYIIVQNTPIRRESPISWLVAVNFGSDSFDPSDPTDPGNPLQEPTRVRFLTRKELLEVDEDVNGNAMVTANDEPVTGIRRAFRDLGVVLEKNFATFNPLAIYIYPGSVSTTTFMGFAPGVALCDDLTADPVTGAFDYYKVRSVVLFRRPLRGTAARAWWDRVRHEGFMVRDIAAGPPKRATDDFGEYKAQKTLLDSDGVETSTAEWLEFENVKSEDLNGMGFNV